MTDRAKDRPAPHSAGPAPTPDLITQLLWEDALVREAAMLADGWRVIKVWFSGAGTEDGERARVRALIRIEDDLRALGAYGQTRALICPGHAQWRFRPGRLEPDDLVRTVRRIIAELDPGDWRLRADQP